jgi:hypothetical protein
MQKGDRPVETHLGLLGTTDGKVDPTQGMAGMLLDPTPRFACEAPEQDHDQTGTEIREGRTTTATHGLACLPPRRSSAGHPLVSPSPLRDS